MTDKKEKKKEEIEAKPKLFDRDAKPWEFVIKASETYKIEFRKTAKIGQAPKVDDIIAKVIDMDEDSLKQEQKEKKEQDTNRKRAAEEEFNSEE